MGKKTEAQKRASAKYEKEKVESIRFCVNKGDREIIKKCASANNETVNGMLYRLVKEEVLKKLGKSEYNKLKKR